MLFTAMDTVVTMVVVVSLLVQARLARQAGHGPAARLRHAAAAAEGDA